MSNRKGQNSLLFLTAVGVVFGLVALAPQAYPQVSKVVDLRDQKSCDSSKASIRNADVELLWFNSNSVWEYVGALESVFDSYPEKKAGWLDVVWTTKDTQRPFRLVDPPSGFLAPLVIDEESRKDLERDVLLLANGFPAANSFEFRVQRNAAETTSTLRLSFSEVGPSTFLAAYSSAFANGRCEAPVDKDYPSVRQIALENAKLSVEDNSLVIVTRLPRGSISPIFLKDVK